jgi:hypothetical protein
VVHCKPTPKPPKSISPARQVRVIYFNTEYNAWFEVDAVVPPSQASIGLSVSAIVPDVGKKRAWVVSIYRQPRMNSPYKTKATHADKDCPDVPEPATAVKFDQKKDLVGTIRLWTSKEDGRQVVAELLEIQKDSAILRSVGDKEFKQPFDSLSDADVKFLRTVDGEAVRLTAVAGE